MKTVKLDTFIENPDNPQTVTAEDFALLVESVRKLPHTLAAAKIAYVTDYVALDGTDLQGRRVVIAGNKRLRALKQLAQDHATSADGQVEFDAPLPAEWFFDLTPLGTEARKAWLVKSNIQSGEWDAEKLLALYDEEQLADLMGDEFSDLIASLSADGANDDYDQYTSEGLTGIYEIKGDAPQVDELMDRRRADELIEEICAADLPPEISNFLCAGAMRHVVFNFRKIAEYYAAAPVSIQRLMEKQLLVIVDFDDAVKNGVVEMNKKMRQFIAHHQKDGYGDAK